VTVTAVIFDVGGVLAHPSAGQFPEDFFGSQAADGDHPWHRLERGELTLAQAYWGAGFLLTIVVVGLSRLLGVWLDRANLAPTPLGLVLLGHLTFLSVLVIWQIVGIWRAAGNHIRSTGRRTWAVLARVAIFAGALRGFVDFNEYGIATGGDGGAG